MNTVEEMQEEANRFEEVADLVNAFYHHMHNQDVAVCIEALAVCFAEISVEYTDGIEDVTEFMTAFMLAMRSRLEAMRDSGDTTH